jgi:monofunctional biosynthetic peptidoglycan transglycosylase
LSRTLTRPAKGKRGGFWRTLRRIVSAVVLVALGAYLACCLGLVLLRWVDPVTTAVQAQRRVESWFSGKPYHKSYRPVPIERVSVQLQRAVVAAEDTHFYKHHGIDWQAVDTVIQEDLDEGRIVRGGSTITQQLVKNLFLSTSRSWIRKGFEFALAPVAELVLNKRRILELYLNVIEWGPGVYGAEAAAQYHYRGTAARLSRDQAVRLAAVIPNPLRRKPARMSHYAGIILTRMGQMGW